MQPQNEENQDTIISHLKTNKTLARIRPNCHKISRKQAQNWKWEDFEEISRIFTLNLEEWKKSPPQALKTHFCYLKIGVNLPREAWGYKKPLNFHLQRVAHLGCLGTTNMTSWMNSHLYTHKLARLTRVMKINQIQTLEISPIVQRCTRPYVKPD